MFDRKTFEAAFFKAVASLSKREEVTKVALRQLSRDALVASYETGDVAFANRLVDALSPMNKKTMRLFFKEFLGFVYDEGTMRFTKKSVKKWEDKQRAGKAFLEDPHNNVWSWAERHVEVERKPFTSADLAESTKKLMERAKKAGISHKEVLKSVLSCGFTAEEVVAIMSSLSKDKGEEPKADDKAKTLTPMDLVGPALI